MRMELVSDKVFQGLDQIRAQRQAFCRELPKSVSTVEVLCDRLAAGSASLDDIRTLEEVAHDLARSGARYGHLVVGLAARELEVAVHCGHLGAVRDALENLKLHAPRAEAA